MKKLNAVHKKNQKEFVLTFLEDGKIVALDVVSGKEKEISGSTVKRWYELGAEIESNEPTIFDQVEEVEKESNLYEYVYRLRGFSLGCQPKGFVSHNEKVGRFGSVSYDRALSSKEMDEYELILLDVKHQDKPEKAERQHSRSSVKKDGSVRKDKFRPKLTADKVYQVLVAYHEGEKKAHIARTFEISFRTVTCIVEGLMWKDVYREFHNQLKGVI